MRGDAWESSGVAEVSWNVTEFCRGPHRSRPELSDSFEVKTSTSKLRRLQTRTVARLFAPTLWLLSKSLVETLGCEKLRLTRLGGHAEH